MPGCYLYGWDAVSETWVKLVANAEGKLIIDPSEIFVDTQVDDEHGKAPTSNWAYDHENDAAGHHARYTDEEAVDSWKNRAMTLTAGSYTALDLTDISFVFMNTATGTIRLYGLAGGYDGKIVYFFKYAKIDPVYVYNESASAAVGNKIRTTDGQTTLIADAYYTVFWMVYYNGYWYLNDFIFSSPYYNFTDTPQDGVSNKAITSNWAYDHAADMTKHVTNGDTHNHLGGDGGTVAHTSLGGIGDTENTHIKWIGYAGTFADAEAPTEAELEAILGLPSDYSTNKLICIDADNIGASGSIYVIVTNGDSFKHLKTIDESSKRNHVNLANIGTNTHAQIDSHISNFTSAHVTNGNTHNHLGGDGGQIAHSSLSGLTNLHVVYGEGAVSSTPTLAQINTIFGNAENYGSATVCVMFATSGTGAGYQWLCAPQGEDPGDWWYHALTKAV